MNAKSRYRRRRSWRSIVTTLAAVVVFVTTYALILPAITMEKEPTCGIEEHTHEESCFATQVSLSCGVHSHGDSCRNEAGELICGMADFVVHTHDASCYLEDGTLLCTLPEITAHTHDESCVQSQTTVHQHDDSCVTAVKGDLICTEEENTGHTHGTDCWRETEVLTCTIPEGEGHSHGEGCFEEQTTQICPLPESEGHSHTEDCLDEAGTVVCGLEESEGHTHGAECFTTESVLICTTAESEPHIHGDACWTVEASLVCGQEETAGHSHEDACYAWTEEVTCGMEEGQEIPSEPVLVCTLEEIVLHTHSDECYGEDGTLSCGMLQVEAHVHSEACLTASEEQAVVCGLEEHTHDEVLCYIDNTADVETEEQWKATLPALTGVWAEDLLTVARSQVGYGESEVNLQVDAEGRVRGYTRYGAWYGEPYSDWNSIFVSFCLHYAGIDREAIAYESNAERWVTVLTAWEQYAAADAYTPVPGDLVFMDLDDNGFADTVAIVKSLEENRLTVYQGDTENRSVEKLEYLLSDTPVETEQKLLLPGDILGYGILPENPNPDGEPEETTEATEATEPETVYYCGQEAHTHGEACYDADGNVICELAEHTHEDACTVAPVRYCGKMEHTHDDSCLDEEGNVVCTLEVHTHTEECDVSPEDGYFCGDSEHEHTILCKANLTDLSEEGRAMVERVILMIEEMPSADEIDAKIAEFEDAEDYEGEETWLTEVYQQVGDVYKEYYFLGNELQPYVVNVDKLMELEYIWSQMTLEEPVEVDAEAAYYCGYVSHGEDCYDADGSLTCTDTTHHVHTDDCLTQYYCGMIDLHVHSGCYYNFTYKCGKVAHTHNYLCTTKPLYCDRETHTHSWADCYDENGRLICTEHVHILSCWVNPAPAGNVTDSEDRYEGVNSFHSNIFLKYQASSHTISSYETGVFVLIPDNSYYEGWLPNTRQWSGSADANYLVAYCSDDRTTASKKGEDYYTYTIDNSRFTDDEQQRKIAAIIGHTYPYLTAAEMRAQMAQAYADGLTVDDNGNLVDVSACVEADWIAATQWAVWNTTSTYGEHTMSDVDIDDRGAPRVPAFPLESERTAINPLTDPGITDIATSRQVLCAVKNYLCSLTEPEALSVDDYTYELKENEDGTYRLDVTVNLNRAIVYGENVQFALSAGDHRTEVSVLPVGDDTITISLDGLTLEDINSARVHLTLDGRHMQAYFFDSDNYQDMVGGNWEYYDEDLSFDLGKEKVDVSVSKVWRNGDLTSDLSVRVQLYSDGRPYGEPAVLNAANSWSYLWTGLNKYNATGAEVNYTIEEELLSGYYSHVEKVTEYTTESTVTIWQEADAFEDGGHYLIVSKFGALVANLFPSGRVPYYLNVGPINVNEVTEAQYKSTWIAEDEDGDGYFTLRNKAFADQYISDDQISSWAEDSYTFVNNHLMRDNYSYFRSFYSNGYHEFTRYENLAMDFTLYKLVEIELPATDINFLVTNSRYIIPETSSVEASVTKQWEGRPDGVYPESVQVQLLANGQPYGDPVTLNAQNEWKYTWTNLPELVDVANGGQVFLQYSVEEIPVEGFTPSYTVEESHSEDNTITYYVNGITNKWTPDEVDMVLKKVDSRTGRLLPGAQFDLYLTTNSEQLAQSGNGVLVPGTDSIYGVHLGAVTVGEDGTAQMKVAPGETYCLVETIAPDGYNRLTTPITFRITESDGIILELLEENEWAAVTNDTQLELVIKNESSYELPETGGPGTTLYTMGGLLLMLTAGLLLMYNQKKRRRGAY